jgi:pilus assembly protein Flp/PilA
MFARLLMMIARFRQDERGASMVEYGLLVALIALVAIAGVTALGTKLSKLFSDIAALLNT